MFKWLKNKNVEEESDEQLIQRFRTLSNNNIFEQLFGRYVELVFGTCLSLLKTEHAAQDASMEIFEKLYLDIQKHEIRHFRPWLYTYTRNYCLGLLRKSQRQQQKSNDFESQQNMQLVDIEHPIINESFDFDPSPMLNDCIEELKTLQKEVVQRFYFDNISYKQISEELAISYNEVRSSLQNARRMLKKCLESSGINKQTFGN